MATYQEQIEKRQKENEAKKARESIELTSDQIENWRKVLYQMLGPYALIMPEEQIIALRDKMQSGLNIFGK